MDRRPTRGWLHGVWNAGYPRSLTETFGKERRTMTRVSRMAAVVTGIVIAATGSGVGLYNYRKPLPPIPQEVKVVEAPAPAVAAPTATTPTPQVTMNCGERQYTVVKGDNLTRIAIAQWGRANAFQWRKIWQDNKGAVKNPNRIYPNQTLSIRDCIEKDDSAPAKVVVKHAAPQRKHKATSHHRSKPHVSPAPAPAPDAAPVPEKHEEPQALASPAQAQIAPVPTPHAEATPPQIPGPQEGVVVPKASPQAPPVIPEAPAPPRLEVKDVPRPMLLPGSFWDSLGTYPVEKDNWINQFHIEQAILIAKALSFNIEPYVSGDIVQDSKQYPWDNKAKAAAGIRLQKPFGHGVINTNFAYGVEQRQKLDHSPKVTKKGFVLSNDGWFGYDQPSPYSKSGLLKSTPGTLWWTAGNLSPFENGNWIVLARGEQGVTLAKAGSMYLIPLGWAQAGYDSKGFSWNRRYTVGGGMQIRFPWNTGIIGATGGYECTRTFGASTPNLCGPTIKADVWTGWIAHIGGGKK